MYSIVQYLEIDTCTLYRKSIGQTSVFKKTHHEKQSNLLLLSIKKIKNI